MAEYVYRYFSKNGTCLYVGRTADLYSRHHSHLSEQWLRDAGDDWIADYITVTSRAEADMWESYLTDLYNPVNSKAKHDWGPISMLDEPYKKLLWTDIRQQLPERPKAKPSKNQFYTFKKETEKKELAASLAVRELRHASDMAKCMSELLFKSEQLPGSFTLSFGPIRLPLDFFQCLNFDKDYDPLFRKPLLEVFEASETGEYKPLYSNIFDLDVAPVGVDHVDINLAKWLEYLSRFIFNASMYIEYYSAYFSNLAVECLEMKKETVKDAD